MSECARPGCLETGINRCSICLREPYCSGDCQKVDWKAHKPICKTLKKLSNLILRPYREVVHSIVEIRVKEFKKAEMNIRVWKNLVSYAEYQFGNRVLGRVYREREDGERIDNWSVEIDILIRIHGCLADAYSRDKSLGTISSSNLRLPLYEEMLDLLRPWSIYLDPNSTFRTDRITKDQINEIFVLSVQVENNIALIYMEQCQFNLVETHCQRGLSYARLYEGTEDDKSTFVCGFLSIFYDLRKVEGNYADASNFAEEAYNCVAIAYNPVHPKVQYAASTLIESLTLKGDFQNAELFAQMTLDSLKDPKNGLDQQSEAVARGYSDLASVIKNQMRNLVKAEKLAREALRIRVLINSSSHVAGFTTGLLSSILMCQDKLGSETKVLLEQTLAINIRNFGPDGANTATAQFNFGLFYRHLAEAQQIVATRKGHLRLSEIKHKEALRVNTKIFGPDNPRTLRYSSELSISRRLLSEA